MFLLEKFSTLRFKLRTYGLHGIIDAIRRKFEPDTPLHLAMLRMAARQKSPPKRGITIIGDMSAHTSMGKVLNDLYEKLRLCNIPCQYLDTSYSTCAINDEFEILRYDHIISIICSRIPKKLTKSVKSSEIVFWEFDSGLLDGYPVLIDGDTKIAMSDFNFTYYQQSMPSKTIKKILYPLQLHWADNTIPASRIRSKFNIPNDAFMVFFNFGLGSKRKNPEAILAAFAKAFKNNHNTILVFKTMYSDRFPACLSSLYDQASNLGIKSRFLTINTYLENDEIYALTSACDVYISLHRGEGFGLGIAEAMQLGKPVIVTDWSASTEFCTSENSIPIPYRFTPIDPSEFNWFPYKGVTRWAEPDIDAAAKALQLLYESPELRKRLGENGRKTILEHFSLDNFKASIDQFLND